jgi:predicted nucleic acid-binding protein
VTKGVFLDSGAFIAFMDRSDTQHAALVDLFRAPPRRWFTSSAVIAETYGWFLHRLGEDRARLFRLLVPELPDLRVLDSDAPHRTLVDARLEILRGRGLSWVDASSLVWLGRHGIQTVWGTDHHLALEGAAVLPGPPVR